MYPPPQILSRRLWSFLLAALLLALGAPVMAQKAKKGGGAPTAKPAKLETFTNSVGMTFVKIPAGSFVMGSEDRTTTATCSECNGKGKVQKERTHSVSEEIRCSSCAGRGLVHCSVYLDPPLRCTYCQNTGWKKCGDCYGSGTRSNYRTVHDGTTTEKCSACGGKGKQTKTEVDDEEKPAHRVTISKAFYMGQTEVTQGQWKAVMGTAPWKGRNDAQEGDNYPAVYVNWDDAQAFILRLNNSPREANNGAHEYRLPTEAEWEYACRAGTKTNYSFGDDEGNLGEYAWFRKNARDAGEKYAHRVGTKKPNPWGLYDMHGNVWEWCQDWYDRGAYSPSPAVDPKGPSSGSFRLMRGGSWEKGDDVCRSAMRGYDTSLPYIWYSSLGFRVVLSAPRTP